MTTTINTSTGRIALDPFVSDLEAETARLRAEGPLAAVELPGGVPVWAVTHHAEARALMTDRRVVKDISLWTAWQRGDIPEDWPLIGLVNPGRSSSLWTARTTAGCAPWSPRPSHRGASTRCGRASWS